MKFTNFKYDRFLTAIIIALSISGILYFGFRAISENLKRKQDNPFEYNIDSFKKSGENFLHYTEVKRIDLKLEQVYGIAVGPNDKMYVSGDNVVHILHADGNLYDTLSTNGAVRCLTVDDSLNLYLGMNDHVEIYDKDGVKTAQFESLGINAIITSIAVTQDYVFIADAGNHIVWKYDKFGNQKGRIGDKDEEKGIPGFVIPSPFFDLSIDADGFLWVVNPGRHSLENYTIEGDFRSSWGEFSMEIEGFCGCCNPIHITILDDDSFVTSEKGIPRVKVYNRLGNFVSLVAGSDQFEEGGYRPDWCEGTEGLDLARDSAGRIYVLDPFRKAVRIFERKNV